MESNLNLLKEIVMDEERIVTYISISKELCIHINDAKLLLKRFVDEIKKEQPAVTLNVQYILSGLSDTASGRITICPETELQDVKNKYKVVYFAHIYSVVKGSNSLDKAVFLATNKFEDFPLCTGLIKNDFCFKRTSEEIGALKTNSQEIISNSSSKTQPQSIRQKDSQQTKTLSKTVSQDKIIKDDLEKVPEIKVKHEPTSPKSKTESVTKSVEKKTTNKSTKGIAGYFNKANGVENAKVKKTETTPIKKEIFEQKFETKPVKVEATPKSQDKCKKEENVSKEDNISASKSKNTVNRSKLNGKVDKKRKRVLHVSDSESDNEENDPFTEKMVVDNESEDEIPPTPSIDTVKITSGIVNPKKRRKIVDKTYTDEDGYILTKKEEVYESCSDKEEEETAKKENIENKTQNKPEKKIEVSPKTKTNKGTKKRISPPQKGKQATMTNFFKKV